MGRVGTTVALTIITFITNIAMLGWWGLITAPLLLSFPYYLIWVDSKLPFDKQWRFVNSDFYKKHNNK